MSGRNYELPKQLRIKRTAPSGEYSFCVDDPNAPGSPPVGYGSNFMEAIGNWLHTNQSKLGLSFIVDESTREDEQLRRERELAKR